MRLVPLWCRANPWWWAVLEVFCPVRALSIRLTGGSAPNRNDLNHHVFSMSGFIGQKSASFTGWTKLDHVRQRWTMFDVVRPSSHYLDQVRPSWNTFCHVRPPWITLDDIGPLSITTIHHCTRRRVSEHFSFSSSLDHIRPGSVSLDHVRPCWTSLDTSIRCNRFF